MGNKIKRNIVSVTTEDDRLFRATRLTKKYSFWQPCSCSFQGQNSSSSSTDLSH